MTHLATFRQSLGLVAALGLLAPTAALSATTDAITFGALPVKTAGDVDFDPGATGRVGHIVEYSSSDTDVASIVNSAGGLRIHIKKPGATAITASQPAFNAFPAATPVTQPLWVWPPPRPVVAWGTNSGLPSGLDSCVAVAVGSYFSLALKKDGTVVEWGSIDSIPTGLSDVVAIAAGDRHALALKRNGAVVAWGRNGEGQLAFPSGLNGVLAISAGYKHSLALKTNGTLVPWGDTSGAHFSFPSGPGFKSISDGFYQSIWVDTFGRAGTSGEGDWGPIPMVPLLWNVNSASSGFSHLAFLKSDSSVVAYTRSPYSTTDTSVPGDLRGVVAISAGRHSTIALKSDSTIAVWGDDKRLVHYPAGLHGVVAVANGWNHALALGIAPPLLPQTVTFGGLPIKTLGDLDFAPGAVNDSGLPVSYSSSDTNVASIVNGKIHIKKVGSTVITAESFGNATHKPADPVSRPLWVWSPPRSVAGWADNQYAEATPPDTLGNVVAIAANSNHSIALRPNGTVVGWGAPLQPKFPADLQGVVAVSVGSDHALALKGDGTVVAAGANSYGQADVPNGLSDVVAIAAGNAFSLALRTDGTVVAWGFNGSGQGKAPVDLRDVIAVSAGRDAFALKNDGTVVAWGQDKVVPSAVRNIVSIAAGNGWGLGLKLDSTVVGWGNNGSRQLDPPQGLSGIVSIAAGAGPLALTSHGTVRNWGSGWTIFTNQGAVPVGLNGVTAIAAGYAELALGSVPVPTLTFDALADRTYGDADFVPATTSSAGQPVTFASSDPNTASILNGKIHIKKAGNAVITASQPASAGYPAAVPVARSLTILPRPDTVNAHAASKAFGTADPVLAYSATPLLNGDVWTGKLSRDPGETAGDYAITQGTLSAGPNYAIVFIGASFSIDPSTAAASRLPKRFVSHELSASAIRPFAAPAIGGGRAALGTESDPTGSSQTLELALTGPATVSVAIFDKLGTPVIAFRKDVAESDLWSLARSGDGRRLLPVTWNLRSANGQPVPTGVYIWKVVVEGSDGQKLETIKRLGVKEQP